MDGSVFCEIQTCSHALDGKHERIASRGVLHVVWVRLVLSFAATLCRGRRSRLCGLHDVLVPFCHAWLEEDIWVDPPNGVVVWQLMTGLYGTRRVALLFQEHVRQAMVKIGFTVVRVAAQTIYHAAWLVLATVHGDDFVASGETQSLDMLDRAWERFFVLRKSELEC